MTVGDLKKYKDSCYSALSRDLTEFEKNFLFVSAGILAFSTTFIKDIVKLSDVVYLPVLFLSWVLIIVSIGLMMNSFLKSANASDQLLVVVDTFQLENDLYLESAVLSTEQWKSIRANVNAILYSSKSKLKRIRKWAVRLFLIGIGALSLFVSLNLISEQQTQSMGKDNKQTIEVTGATQKIIIVPSESK